jgi:DNA-binding transcriptional MerR regulator
MIDAQGIADAVNARTGDSVSPRMVREYVRLGILRKALHPGRYGYDARNVEAMVEARRLVRIGLSLQEVCERMRAFTPPAAGPEVASLPARRWIDLGRFGSLAVELPERLGEAERSNLFHALEGAAQAYTAGLNQE